MYLEKTTDMEFKLKLLYKKICNFKRKEEKKEKKNNRLITASL